ncbi:MAG: hypothetical protein ACLFPA_10290 [Dichotomicrobium sp.]
MSASGNGIQDKLAGRAGRQQDADQPGPLRRTFMRFSTSWKSILLILGLTILSWISTYTGMLELITANAGRISLIITIAVGFAVAILQLMILFILDQFFSRSFYQGKRVLAIFPLYLAGYLFLTLISVGFGFGFYWKYLEARTEASASAEASISQVQSQLQQGASQLEQLQSTLGTLATISAERAETEREEGGTCLQSGPGAGPRMRLREADASRFAFAQEFVGSRTGQIQDDIQSLSRKLDRVIANDPSTIDRQSGTRNAFLSGLNRDLNLVSSRFNALRNNSQLLSLRDEFAERADQTVFQSNGGTFRCPDQALSSALNGVVRAIDELPRLDPPRINPVEGSAAVVEAFRRLTTSLYGVLQLDVAPTPEELREARERAVAAGEDPATVEARSGLGTRDFIPLAIAIFVDFCILLVSMNRPFHAFRAFYGGVEEARTREMGEFMRMFREVFFDEFHRRPSPDEMLSPIQDVVFDHRGDYYAAVPLEVGGADTDRRRKARYIANILFALETRGFVNLIRRRARAHGSEEAPKATRLERITGKHGWADLSAFARGQLKDRGSEFAGANDFRIYKFAKGKWPEIALRTVVSAHKEEANYRQEFPEMRPIPSREVDRGALEAASEERPAELEGDDPPRRLTHQRSDEDAEGEPGQDWHGAADEQAGYPDTPPLYDRDEDPDPDFYTDSPWPDHHGGPPGSATGETDDPEETDRPRKPNGGPDGQHDT